MYGGGGYRPVSVTLPKQKVIWGWENQSSRDSAPRHHAVVALVRKKYILVKI